MRRTPGLLIGLSAMLLLFTGVASAETGVILTSSETGFLSELFNIISSYIDELTALFEGSLN